MIGLETIEIVSANRIKAVAIATKSHNSVAAVSKFKMAGFRLKSGLKSLKNKVYKFKKQQKRLGIPKGGIGACFFGIIKRRKHQLGRFTAVEVTRHE